MEFAGGRDQMTEHSDQKQYRIIRGISGVKRVRRALGDNAPESDHNTQEDVRSDPGHRALDMGLEGGKVVWKAGNTPQNKRLDLVQYLVYK